MSYFSTKSFTSAVIACAALIGITTASPALSDDQVDAQGTEIFAGFDAKEDAWFSYIGSVIAFNGDLNQSGFLGRALVGYGEYDYDTRFPGVPGVPFHVAKIDGEVVNLDAMLGYQIVEGPVTFKAFAGVNWQNHDLKRTSLLTSGGMAPAVAFPSGDPFNPVRGDEVGFKGQLEVWAALGDAFNISAIGSYSTAFDSYWARGRVGYTLMSPVTIGPEVIVLGNERFDQVRVGGFVGLNLDIVNLSFNLGHADDDNNGNSIYGGASLSKRF